MATGSNEHIGVLLADNGDGIGASHLLQCQSYCRFEVMLCCPKVGMFDQMRKDFGIRLGAEGMSIAFQFCTQFRVVLDDAVMDDGQSTCAVWMGMRVGIVGASMRCPARVTDAEG